MGDKKNPSMNRRLFLKAASAQIALPFLESLVPSNAFAQSSARQNFIGVYRPNGDYMPGHISNGKVIVPNGDFTWNGSLAPLVSAGHKNNVAILRGFKNRYNNDQHWSGTAGFLSVANIKTQKSTDLQCGKSIDQMIADKYDTPIHSLQLGLQDRNYSEHPATHSPKYLSVISWRDTYTPLSKMSHPQQLFHLLFSTANLSAAELQYMKTSKKSVLDSVLDQIQKTKSKASSGDQQLLDSYLTGIREIEQDLNRTQPACTVPNMTIPSFPSHQEHHRIYHRLIVKALECGLTNSISLMYDDGVGLNDLIHPGVSHKHHVAVHHGGAADRIASAKAISRIYSTLFAHLLTELKNSNLLNSTLLVYGTDMSDGNNHYYENLPILVAGAGSDFRFGQEIGSYNQSKNLANVYMELLRKFGVTSVSRLGSGTNASNGQASGLIV